MKVFCILQVMTVILGASTACPEQCSCNEKDQSLNCFGLEKLPEAPNILNYTSFMFTSCNFQEEISVIPYPRSLTVHFESCHKVSFSPDAFKNVNQLQSLSITRNPFLEALPLLQLSELNRLDLTANQLTSFQDKFFSKLPKLQYLDLSNNKINFTKNLFEGASQMLSELLCLDCKLEFIPTESLSHLKELKKLKLNLNPIKVINESSFDFAVNLEELDLNSCSLFEITSNAFQHLSKLEVLNLGYNALHQLEPAVFKPCWRSLKELYLEHNKFTFVQDDLAPWNTLDHLKLGHNPWNCECNLAWVTSLNMEKIDPENVTCETPANLQGQNLYQVVSHLNSCHSNRSRVALGIGIPILIVCFLLVIYYVYQMIKNHRRKARQRATVKYSNVYGETVESNSKQAILG